MKNKKSNNQSKLENASGIQPIQFETKDGVILIHSHAEAEMVFRIASYACGSFTWTPGRDHVSNYANKVDHRYRESKQRDNQFNN